MNEVPSQTINPPETTDTIPLETPNLKESIQTNEDMNLTESVHSSKALELQKDQDLELAKSSSAMQSKVRDLESLQSPFLIRLVQDRPLLICVFVSTFQKPFVSGTSNTQETSPVSRMSSRTPSQEVLSSVEASRQRSSEEQELSLVKRASEELLKLLTDPELADELAVECAEKALQRYISPIMKEQELKVITEAEKVQ